MPIVTIHPSGTARSPAIDPISRAVLPTARIAVLSDTVVTPVASMPVGTPFRALTAAGKRQAHALPTPSRTTPSRRYPRLETETGPFPIVEGPRAGPIPVAPQPDLIPAPGHTAPPETEEPAVEKLAEPETYFPWWWLVVAAIGTHMLLKKKG